MRTRKRSARALFTLLLAIGLTPNTAFAAAKEKKKSSEQQEQSAGKVDVNTASQAELEALPGVGEATAKKIIEGRPYSSVSALSKAGVSEATLKKIRPLVKASRGSSSESAKTESTDTEKPSSSEKKSSKSESESSSKASGNVDLNAASQSELEALPGVGAVPRRRSSPGVRTRRWTTSPKPASPPRRSRRSAAACQPQEARRAQARNHPASAIVHAPRQRAKLLNRKLRVLPKPTTEAPHRQAICRRAIPAPRLRAEATARFG